MRSLARTVAIGALVSPLAIASAGTASAGQQAELNNGNSNSNPLVNSQVNLADSAADQVQIATSVATAGGGFSPVID